MNNRIVRVAVNGYGVIGKRVADAIILQDDMELCGVADVVTDYRIRLAVERGYPVYPATQERRAVMEAEGIALAGTLDDLLDRVDVVADCTKESRRAESRPLSTPGYQVDLARWRKA
jgi:glyceraldehyde-3-phosphate dehydrogenase (NAD(P))